MYEHHFNDMRVTPGGLDTRTLEQDLPNPFTSHLAPDPLNAILNITVLS